MTDKEITDIQQLASSLADDNGPAGKLANAVLMMYHMHPSQLAAPKGHTATSGAGAAVEAREPDGKLIGTRGK